MYELNGIMIVGEITPELKVVNARATNDWMMLVTFSNGETRVFDGTNLFGKPVYEPLRDQTVFDDFAIDHAILTWDSSIDIDTNNLYNLTYPYDTITDTSSANTPIQLRPCNANSFTDQQHSKDPAIACITCLTLPIAAA